MSDDQYTYLVWDEINGSEEDAEEVYGPAAFDAAERYAEDDVDGQTDGIYASGHPVCVRNSRGELFTFIVTADYSVTFSARLRQP